MFISAAILSIKIMRQASTLLWYRFHCFWHRTTSWRNYLLARNLVKIEAGVFKEMPYVAVADADLMAVRLRRQPPPDDIGLRLQPRADPRSHYIELGPIYCRP